MSARLRVVAGPYALVLLLATVVAPWVADVHLRLTDDQACGPSVFGPRHSAPQFETTRTAEPSAHCLACHWVRALTGAAPAPTASADPPLAMRNARPGADVWWFGEVVSSDQPPRAPPPVL